MWYAFTAYNQTAQYGWTQDPSLAERACDWLNRRGGSNHYGCRALSPAEVEALRLADWGEGLLLTDDTTAEDFGFPLHIWLRGADGEIDGGEVPEPLETDLQAACREAVAEAVGAGEADWTGWRVEVLQEGEVVERYDVAALA